jgi:preprotein translocase subunit Sss1
VGTKFKEINTLSFIGHIGPKTERVWKEVDEEVDIIGCRKKFDRPCQLIAPLNLLATIRIILYTRKPVADEYIERAKRAEQPIS